MSNFNKLQQKTRELVAIAAATGALATPAVVTNPAEAAVKAKNKIERVTSVKPETKVKVWEKQRAAEATERFRNNEEVAFLDGVLSRRVKIPNGGSAITNGVQAEYSGGVSMKSEEISRGYSDMDRVIEGPVVLSRHDQKTSSADLKNPDEISYAKAAWLQGEGVVFIPVGGYNEKTDTLNMLSERTDGSAPINFGFVPENELGTMPKAGSRMSTNTVGGTNKGGPGPLVAEAAHEVLVPHAQAPQILSY